MLKELPRKVRYVFVGSLILNVLLIMWVAFGLWANWYIDSTGVLKYAEINAFQYKFCERDYQRNLDDIDKTYGTDDPKRAADLKNSYAINVCLKNYKTGERLDVQPLVDQVDK
jgi:hypothetical protein